MPGDPAVREFGEKVEYLLPNHSGVEVSRLDYQHKTLQRAVELAGDPWPFLLPSQYKLELQPGDHVLDSGTGTAAWLLDAASRTEIPNHHIHFNGIDMTSQKFPPPHTLPSNVKLSLGNVLSLPPAWTGKYAFVHQRLLKAALTRSHWHTNISEISRVLKPGGWAVWVEIGIPFGGIVTQKVAHTMFLLVQNKDYLRDPGPYIYDYLKTTTSKKGGKSSSDELGFNPETVHMKTYKWCVGKRAKTMDEDYVEAITRTFIASTIAYGYTMDDAGVSSGVRELVNNREEWVSLVKDMEREWSEIDEAFVDIRVVCAQKRF